MTSLTSTFTTTVPLLPDNREHALIHSTTDGTRFFKTGDACTKRRRLPRSSTQHSIPSTRSLPEETQPRAYRPLVLENASVGVWSAVQSFCPVFIHSLTPQQALTEVENYKRQNRHVLVSQKRPRSLTQASTRPNASSTQSALSLPEEPQPSANRPPVLATDNVWTATRSDGPDSSLVLQPETATNNDDPTLAVDDDSLPDVPDDLLYEFDDEVSNDNDTSSSNFIPAQSPRHIVPTNLRRGNPTIRYTREETLRIEATQERIWKETRRPNRQAVPSEYDWQPKITTAIVEEDEPPPISDDSADFPLDDSAIDDDSISDDETSTQSDADSSTATLPSTVSGNDDDVPTVSNVDTALIPSPAPPFVANEPTVRIGTDAIRTRRRRRRVPPPPMVESTMEHITTGYGSMYIVEERYPRQVVRRSCRTYPTYQPGKYKC